MCWPRARAGKRKRSPCGASDWCACCAKLRAMRKSLPTRDQLLMRMGAAKTEAGRAFGFVKMQVPEDRPSGHARDVPVSAWTRPSSSGRTARRPLPAALQSDGRRSQRAVDALRATDADRVRVSIFEERTGHSAHLSSTGASRRCAHADCLSGLLLQVTLKNRLMMHAPGLTPAAVLEKMATIQMIEVWIPTVDGRWLILPRYTQPAPTPSCSSRS